MKTLLKVIKWVDDNLLNTFLTLYIFAVALFPKLPLFHVEYTYIRIRYDDFFIIPIFLLFVIQVVRKKIPLRLNYWYLFVLFWLAVFISFAYGFYIQKTVPVFQQGLLHSLRRVQYMIIFFVATSSIISEKRFFTYMRIYLVVVFLVAVYALGQKFLHFPSIQSINPAYVDGRLLILKPEDRVNSTFGGHFDLAAYLVFAIPIVLGFLFYLRHKRYFFLYIFLIAILLYTTARSSFIAFVSSTSTLLLYARKFMFLIVSVIIIAALLFTTGDEMTKRFQQTIQIKTVFVNPLTGLMIIDQKISTKKLPAGSFNIPLKLKTSSKQNSQDSEKIKTVALEQAVQEAKDKSTPATNKEIEKRAKQIAKIIKPQKRLLCDISCATRLQIEWPRAIGAFLLNPLVGSGPSSITEATDNSFLRWLGEFGLLGASIFSILLYKISRYIWAAAKKINSDKKFVYYGYVFGLIALLINSLYVDVFEASKLAYNFWLVSGFYIGLIEVNKKRQV